MKLWCALLCWECGFNHQAAGRVKCNENWSTEGSCIAACSVSWYPPGEFQHLQAKRQTAVTSSSPRWPECVSLFFESGLWWTAINQMMTVLLKARLLYSFSCWGGWAGERDSTCSSPLWLLHRVQVHKALWSSSAPSAPGKPELPQMDLVTGTS